jgi:hypothetical protein
MFGLKTSQSPILTIFIAVIISAYNHHTTDIVIQSGLSSVIVDAKAETDSASITEGDVPLQVKSPHLHLLLRPIQTRLFEHSQMMIRV